MLFGEHAVLYGEPAIVAAVNRYLTISLKPRLDRQIIINSPDFISWQGTLDQLACIPEQLNYVREALLAYKPFLTDGMEITIDATNFSSRVGLGSSAAITVGLVTLLMWLTNADSWKHDQNNNVRVYKQALKIVHRISQEASGADVAASVFGGVNFYRPVHRNNEDHITNTDGITSKLLIETLETALDLPIFLCYVGYKVITALVIKHVRTFFANKPSLLKAITKAIGLVVTQAKEALLVKNWHLLGELMLVHQGLQTSLATCDAKLDKIVYQLLEQDGVYGAKISGSGLGDCVLGLGHVTDSVNLAGELIKIAISRDGLHFIHE